MRKFLATVALTLSLSLSLHAQSVEVRFLYGEPSEKSEKPVTNGENRVVVRNYKLAKHTEGLRLTIPKEHIAADVWGIEVIPSFMKAKKGDEGYWMSARGMYGHFDKDNGSYKSAKSVMPIYAMKRGDNLWWGHVKKWRFDYYFIARATNGEYETALRFRADGVRKYFDIYNDIVVDYNCLKGKDATYANIAKAYQKYQIDNSGVKPIKERINEQPELDYLTESIVVRIQTHCAKPIADISSKSPERVKADFTAETEYPLEVHMPFGVAGEFVQAIKDSGVDKATFVSAGWNYGGYDGRTPQHFPVEQAIGGETGLRRLIEKTQKLGYQMTLHATNTDGYTVSPMWDPWWAGKLKDGSFDRGFIWAGGWCINVCQVASWGKWVPEELKRMADLGVKGPHYIDVYSATYPNRCADPRHPATPEQMAEIQNKILAESKRLMGGAASEGGYDHVAANIDYINYAGRELKSLSEGKYPFASGVYPMWELVYHGIILYNSDRSTQNHTRGKCLYKLEKSGDPRWMEGDGIVDPKISLKIVEFGGRPIFYTYKFADVPRIKRAWDEFVPVRHLQKELMTDHHSVGENLFLTAYADGSKTICNYNDKTVVWEGKSIAPISYILINPDGSVYVPKAF